MQTQGQVKIIGNYSYNLKHCLGEGAYGKVYQGIDTINNSKVAIKKLDLKNFERDTYLKNQIISEIEILKKFNHKNIVQFIDLITTQRSLYIITEFCKDGDLRELMTRKRFNEQESWKILKQIVQGFKELVSNAIIHRDLKPANILSHDGVYKIADFGFAKYVDNFSSQLLRSCVGSPLYMAPQILARKPYSTKCDIWSLGIIFYEMVFQDVPWKGRDERDLLKNILSVPLGWKRNVTQISAKSEDFLKKSLTIEESERMSWDKVFEIFEVSALPSNEVVKVAIPSQVTQFPQNPQNNQNTQNNQNAQNAQNVQNAQNAQNTQATVQPTSSLLKDAQRKKSIFNQQQTVQQSLSINQLKQQHHEIVFRNFVLCAELQSKYQYLKQQVNPSHLNLEKLNLCLSKTNIQMQNNLISTCLQYAAQQPNLQLILKKELDYYIQFHNELVECYQRNGQMVHCERDLDFNGLRDPNQPLTDSDQEKALSLVNQLIKMIWYIVFYNKSQELFDEFKRGAQQNRQNMILLDNMLDIIGIHRKVQRSVEIDYDQLNADKAEDEDPKSLLNKVQEKLRQ